MRAMKKTLFIISVLALFVGCNTAKFSIQEKKNHKKEL